MEKIGTVPELENGGKREAAAEAAVFRRVVRLNDIVISRRRDLSFSPPTARLSQKGESWVARLSEEATLESWS